MLEGNNYQFVDTVFLFEAGDVSCAQEFVWNSFMAVVQKKYLELVLKMSKD